MRIALVTPGFSAHASDWAIPALLNLACALAQTHEIHVFSQRYPAEGTYRFSGLIHHAVGGGQKFGPMSARIWLQTTQAIIHQHRQTPFDLLHAFWADEAGFSAALAGGWLKRPVVVSLGGGELTYLPDIHYGAQRFLTRRLTTRYALKKAALVTAGSNYQLDLCRAHDLPEAKLRLAPLGVDAHLFQPVDSSPQLDQPVMVQAASLVPVKNQHLLLEVLSLAKKEIPQLRLNLAGSGPLQAELAKLARRLDLDQNLVWRAASSLSPPGSILPGVAPLPANLAARVARYGRVGSNGLRFARSGHTRWDRPGGGLFAAPGFCRSSGGTGYRNSW